jgi:hypothetical protein
MDRGFKRVWIVAVRAITKMRLDSGGCRTNLHFVGCREALPSSAPLAMTVGCSASDSRNDGCYRLDQR